VTAAANVRRSLEQAAVPRGRHVALAAACLGLALGPRVPMAAVVLGAGATLGAALRIPLVARRGAGFALAALVLGAAAFAHARTAVLDHSALPPSFGRAVSGEATVLAAVRTDRTGGRRVLVRWRGEPVLLRLPRWETTPAPAIGAIVAADGRLAPPDLAAASVHAHAVLRATSVRPTGRRRGGAAGLVDRIRACAERALDAGRLPRPEAALLRGMVLGEDSALPDDVRDAFQAAGLTHLVAASGQNIMLLAALALGIATVAGLGLRGRWLLVLALIMVYVPLAGAGPSIQRAGIMGAATLAASLAGRPASRWYVLLAAAALTLALDPRSLAEPGWQLSFAAVAGIAVLAAPARDRLRRAGLPAAVAEIAGVTIAAGLATAPIIAWRFDRASLVSLPVNVLAAPAVAPVMWLGMLAAALGQLGPGLGTPLVTLAGLPLGFLVWLGRAAAALPGAQVAAPAAAVAVLAGLAAFAIAAREDPGVRSTSGRRRVRGRVAAVLVAAGVTVPVLLALAARRAQAPSMPAATLRVSALDVGQGDATLVQAGGHAVLVDSGPPGTPLVARLRRAGVRRLDALVLTHPQTDHDGGAPEVLRGLPVALLLDGRGGDRSASSLAIDAPLRADATRVVAAAAGQELRAGDLSLRVLWPPPGPAPAGGDPNDRAIVALASAYGARVLLTADAESPVLAGLDLPTVDVLKVSHHGSADPGLPALLDRVRPRVALIEVGRHNTYGHPAPTTIQALAATVPTVRRTDRDGTIRVDLHAGRATLATERAG